MIWSFKRKGWFVTSLSGSLIAVICTSIMIGVSRYYDYHTFIPLYDAFAFVLLVFSILILFANIYFAAKPSVTTFFISLLVAIFSILYQILYGILVISFIRSLALGSVAYTRWEDKFNDLELDTLQERLNCCGFETTSDKPGRNGFCYRDDLPNKPVACSVKIESNIITPFIVSGAFLIIAAACNAGAVVFSLMLRKSDPNEEISPDNETMLAAGLL